MEAYLRRFVTDQSFSKPFISLEDLEKIKAEARETAAQFKENQDEPTD